MPNPLLRVDERVVPTLQRAARALARGLGAPLRWLARWEEGVADGRLVAVIERRSRVVVLLAVAIAFGGSAVHLQRYPELREAQRQAASPDPDPVATLPGETATTPQVVTVGPALGEDLEAYVAQRQAALAGLPDAQRALAVVSLTAYADAAAVAEWLGPDTVPLQAQYRIPADDAAPSSVEVLGGDLEGAVSRAVAAARAPIAEEEQAAKDLLASGTVEDEGFREDLELRVSELQAIRNLLDSGAPVLFAVVVEGPISSLRALAERDDVRLVDPAPPGAAQDTAIFYGLLPEDADEASYGRR